MVFYSTPLENFPCSSAQDPGTEKFPTGLCLVWQNHLKICRPRRTQKRCGPCHRSPLRALSRIDGISAGCAASLWGSSNASRERRASPFRAGWQSPKRNVGDLLAYGNTNFQPELPLQSYLDDHKLCREQGGKTHQ
jgi:hypothetical protein